MKKVAVVILNWNGKDLLDRFLPSVIANSPEEIADVIVADNGSTDGSLEMLSEKFPSVKQMKFDQNYGFAGGYNCAISQLDALYTVLLNSDIEVTPHWLEAPLALLDSDAQIAGVQPKILDWKDKRRFEYAGAAGGWIDCYGYPFCRGRVLRDIETDEGQYDTMCDIFWASGACLFIRTSVYRDEGGLDARFFAHQEEIDLCWRLRSRGYRFVYTPESVVYHVGGATLEKENPRKTFLNFRNNLLMVYKNMPVNELNKVMRLRLCMDYLAAARFFLTGDWKNTFAVLKARWSFRKLKKIYIPVRQENIAKTTVTTIPEMLPRSLVFAYYLKGKRTFPVLQGALSLSAEKRSLS